jgi:hypothetical protein
MRSELVQAGEAPASRLRTRGRLLRLDPRRADPRGWRLAELVAVERGVSLKALFQPDRGQADIALARQLAMYLMHVEFGRLYADVGRFFHRDRTTVSHACALIEDLRDDPEFDVMLERLRLALLEEAIREREAGDAAA